MPPSRQRIERCLHLTITQYLRRYLPPSRHPYLVVASQINLAPDLRTLKIHFSLCPHELEGENPHHRKDFFERTILPHQAPLKRYLASSLGKTLRRTPRDLYFHLDERIPTAKKLYHLLEAVPRSVTGEQERVATSGKSSQEGAQ